jgi:hypothetical protein
MFPSLHKNHLCGLLSSETGCMGLLTIRDGFAGFNEWDFRGRVRWVGKPWKRGQSERHGVTVTLLNCEVLSVVVLPLPTARPI